MNEQNNHNEQDDQIACFFEIFDASLPRLAPGSGELTARALERLLSNAAARHGQSALDKLRVLDIGCGNGGATLELARRLDGTILAVDNHRPFLDELLRRAQTEGLADKIEPCLADMSQMEMDDGSFDLIWSEGALYLMGVEQGLALCHRLLKPDGMLAISDLVWFRHDRPAKCHEFFGNLCPWMTDVSGNLALMDRAGFEVIDHFVFPKSAWDSFYGPVEKRLGLLREERADQPGMIEMIESMEEEIEIFREYSEYYGYVFYQMRRR